MALRKRADSPEILVDDVAPHGVADAEVWHRGQGDKKLGPVARRRLVDHTHKEHPAQRSQGRGPVAVPFYPSHSREVSVFIYLFIPRHFHN